MIMSTNFRKGTGGVPRSSSWCRDGVRSCRLLGSLISTSPTKGPRAATSPALLIHEVQHR